MIPKIIHQVWLDRRYEHNILPPGKYVKLGYSREFQRLNPGFQYMFWNMARAQNLLSQEPYIKYKAFFNNMRHHIEKCDFIRYVILHKYGGIYFDLDVKPYSPFDELSLQRDILLIFEPIPTETGRPDITNVYMGSEAGHKFWLDLMDHIMENYKAGDLIQVYANTGTRALTDFVRQRYPELEKTIDSNESCRYLSKYVAGYEYKVIDRCEKVNDDQKISDINWLDGSLWGMGCSYKEDDFGNIVYQNFTVSHAIITAVLLFIIIGFIIAIIILSIKLNNKIKTTR